MRPLIHTWRISAVSCIIILLFFVHGVQAQTETTADSLLKSILALPTDTARTTALTKFQRTYNRSNAELALIADSVLVDLARKTHNDTTEMKALYRLAFQYNLLSDYPHSINYSFKAIDLAVKVKDHRREGELYLNLSNNYRDIKDSVKSLESINKAMEIGQKNNDKSLLADALFDLGVWYAVAKQYEKAVEHYRQSIKMYTELGYYDAVVSTLVNMATILKQTKHYDEALAAFQQAIISTDSLHDDYSKAIIINNMANLYADMGRLQESEKTAFTAIGLSYVVEEKKIRLDMYNTLKNLYTKEKRYPEAMDYFSRWVAIKDSLFNEEKALQVGDLEHKYNTSLKDKQIATQQVQLAYNKKLNLVLGGVALVVLLVSGFIYYNLRKTANLNRTVSAQRDVLATQSNILSKQSEKLSLMMKELHHRVKNNLQIITSLLNLQSMRVTDKDSLYAVKESRQRVQAMALIHQRLYKTDGITDINMREYVTELVNFLAAAYGFKEPNYILKLDVQDEWVDVDKALPMGLILNELLTNAFKYAFTVIRKVPRLEISFTKADGHYTLVVKDNGIGMPRGEWNEKSNKSFGNQLVEALCGQLRAKETLVVDGGTSFTFVIPEAA
jgi:two-component sensor histidine kinase